MADTKNDRGLDLTSIALIALGGYFVGSWAEKRKAAEGKLSRVERDDPRATEEVVERVEKALARVRFGNHAKRERDITYALTKFLAKELPQYSVEMQPRTGHGEPDILIEATVAVEVKFAMKKADADRAVGQCSNYALQWVTFIVAFATPLSRVQYLENLLADNELDTIEVYAAR